MSGEDALVPIGSLGIAIGIILVIGGIISLIPQHWRIIRTKSSHGLSSMMLFLGNINQFSCIVGAVIVKYPQLQACYTAGFGACLPSLLSLIQIIAVFLLFLPLHFLYLMYQNEEERRTPEGRTERFKAKMLLVAFFAYAAATSLVAAHLIIFAGQSAWPTLHFAYIMGLVSAAMNVVQWTPQIMRTYKEKHAGAVSITMLLIQAPGSILMFIFFCFISHDSPVVWISTLTTAVQQIILLSLLFKYESPKPIPPLQEEERKRLLSEEDDCISPDWRNATKNPSVNGHTSPNGPTSRTGLWKSRSSNIRK